MKKEKITKDVKISVRIGRQERDFAKKVLKGKSIELSEFIRQSLYDFVSKSQPFEQGTSLSLKK